jgi:hypothetical protein
VVMSLYMCKLHGHKENTTAVLLIVCVLRGLPNSGFTCHNIVTCRGVLMIKVTGSRSEDWIHWHFGYKFS